MCASRSFRLRIGMADIRIARLHAGSTDFPRQRNIQRNRRSCGIIPSDRLHEPHAGVRLHSDVLSACGRTFQSSLEWLCPNSGRSTTVKPAYSSHLPVDSLPSHLLYIIKVSYDYSSCLCVTKCLPIVVHLLSASSPTL